MIYHKVALARDVEGGLIRNVVEGSTIPYARACAEVYVSDTCGGRKKGGGWFTLGSS